MFRVIVLPSICITINDFFLVEFILSVSALDVGIMEWNWYLKVKLDYKMIGMLMQMLILSLPENGGIRLRLASF